MVKTLGMARKVDDLGRIVLPVEMRRLFGIKPGDELEISVDEGAILLRKIEARCVFCEGPDDLRDHKGKLVCGACADELRAGAAADGERQRVDAAAGSPELAGNRVDG